MIAQIYNHPVFEFSDPTMTAPDKAPRRSPYSLLEWPYSRLCLRACGEFKLGTDPQGDFKVHSLKKTAALGPYLSGVPIVRTSDIYRLECEDLVDTEDDTQQWRALKSYLITYDTALAVLREYGTTPHAMLDFQMTVQHYPMAPGTDLFNGVTNPHDPQCVPQGWEVLRDAWGIDPWTVWNGDIGQMDVLPLPAEMGLLAEPVYVCLLSLLTIAGLYELERRKQHDLPRLPKGPAAVSVVDGKAMYRITGALRDYTGVCAEDTGKGKDAVLSLLRVYREKIELEKTESDTVRQVIEKWGGTVFSDRPETDNTDLTTERRDWAKLRALLDRIQLMREELATAWFVLADLYAKEADKITDAHQKRGATLQRVETLRTEQGGNDTKLYGNLWALYPHMAIVPAQGAYERKTDVLGRTIILARPGLDDVKDPHTQLHLNLDIPDQEPVLALADRMGLHGGLMAQAFVGMHKLYQNKGGMSGDRPNAVEVSLSDLAHIMRPKADFSKGLSKVFRTDIAPLDLFNDLLAFMQHMSFEVPNKNGREYITGLFFVTRLFAPHDAKRADQIKVRITMNESIHQAMSTGLDEGVRYMLCNTEAMMAYHSAQLAHGPAMQLALESLIRNNMHKGVNQKAGASTIMLPEISYARLAHRAGMVSAGVGPAQLIRSVDNYLSIQQELKVITRWKKIAGGDNKDPLRNSLEIESGPGYALQKQVFTLENELRTLDRYLENPLARKAEDVKRRGRPKKTNT